MNKIQFLKKYFLLTLVSIAGFFAAVLVNLFFPQAASVEIKSYAVSNSVSLTADQAYRLVLAGLIFLYGAIGVYSFFRGELRERYLSRVPFRLAMGLALALWDILGTKLLLLPQPFFPGPSKIIESFLMEGDYIFQT